VRATVEDLHQQFALLIAIRDKLSETHTAANRILALREELARWRSNTEVHDRVATIDRQLAEIDQELIERSPGLSYANPIRLNAKLAALSAMVGSADAAPTRQAHGVFEELSAHLARQQSRLREVDAAIAEVNATLRALNVAIVGAASIVGAEQ
jgi:chromosome segregation ATPase